MDGEREAAASLLPNQTSVLMHARHLRMLADLAVHDEGASGGLRCYAVAALHADNQSSSQGERRLGEALLSKTPDTSSHLLQRWGLIYQATVGKFAAAAVALLVKHLRTEQQLLRACHDWTRARGSRVMPLDVKVTDDTTKHCAKQRDRGHFVVVAPGNKCRVWM